jgi:hypothetical protein
MICEIMPRSRFPEYFILCRIMLEPLEIRVPGTEKWAGGGRGKRIICVTEVRISEDP